MGKMNIVLKDELEERFREAIFKSKGMRKGNMSKAFEEALEMWIKSTNKKEVRQKCQE
jgi:hypothetical protein